MDTFVDGKAPSPECCGTLAVPVGMVIVDSESGSHPKCGLETWLALGASLEETPLAESCWLVGMAE